MNNEMVIKIVDTRRNNYGTAAGFWCCASLFLGYLFYGSMKKNERLERENNRLKEELSRTEFERVK